MVTPSEYSRDVTQIKNNYIRCSTTSFNRVLERSTYKNFSHIARVNIQRSSTIKMFPKKKEKESFPVKSTKKRIKRPLPFAH
jgi:hypothetical protein